MNRTLSGLLLSVVGAVLVLLPLWANSGLVFLAGTTMVVGVFALSWNLLFGYAGLASFGSVDSAISSRNCPSNPPRSITAIV